VFRYDRYRDVEVMVRENYDMRRPVSLCLVKQDRWVEELFSLAGRAAVVAAVG